MKIAIVFYSFSDNTKKAGLFLKERLTAQNVDVDMLRLAPVSQTTSFFRQALQAALKKKPKLQEVYDLAPYQAVIFASPVWAFTYAPALRSYLAQVGTLSGKKVFCFVTYGSGTGSQKALEELMDTLHQKGVDILFSTSIKGNKSGDENYLESRFQILLKRAAV